MIGKVELKIFFNPNNSELNLFSDATLQILTSSENPNFKIIFQDMFPVELSTLNFDATSEDVAYFTAESLSSILSTI